MSKLKVGDRVKHKVFGNGTIVFIDNNITSSFAVNFDITCSCLHSLGQCGAPKVEFGHGWWCHESELTLIEEKTDLKRNTDLKNILVIFNDKETIIIDKNTKKKYITKAYKEKDDKEKGLAICLLKMYGISYFDLKEMIEKAIK